MSQLSVCRCWPTRFQLVLAGSAVFAAGLAGAWVWQAQLTPQPATRSASPYSSLDSVPPHAVNSPLARPANQVELDDDLTVLGVSIGNRHRAYLLSALGGSPQAHVVNDLLDGVPVSLAACDRNGCVRVFTSPTRGSRLDVSFGGFWRGRFYLRAGKVRYDHDTLEPVEHGQNPFPYPELESVITSWKAWREAHPDTDVYLGDREPQQRE